MFFCYIQANFHNVFAFNPQYSFQRLHEAINIYGSHGKVWHSVGEYVQTRTHTQCRERWTSVLIGGKKLRPWTEEDKAALMEYTRERIEAGTYIYTHTVFA